MVRNTLYITTLTLAFGAGLLAFGSGRSYADGTYDGRPSAPSSSSSSGMTMPPPPPPPPPTGDPLSPPPMPRTPTPYDQDGGGLPPAY